MVAGHSFAIVLKNSRDSDTFKIGDPDIDPKDVTIQSYPGKELKPGETAKLVWETTKLGQDTTGSLLLTTPKTSSMPGAGYYFGAKISLDRAGTDFPATFFQTAHGHAGTLFEWSAPVVHRGGDKFVLEDSKTAHYEVTIKHMENEPAWTVEVEITKLLLEGD